MFKLTRVNVPDFQQRLGSQEKNQLAELGEETEVLPKGAACFLRKGLQLVKPPEVNLRIRTSRGPGPKLRRTT